MAGARVQGIDVEPFGRDVDRVADRLRSLPQVRLTAPLPGGGTPLTLARELSAALAVAGQGVEERDAPQPPRWRRLPELAAHAAGDQVAVTGHDLARALRLALEAHADGDGEVWTPSGRRTLRQVLDEAAEAVAEVRHRL